MLWKFEIFGTHVLKAQRTLFMGSNTSHQVSFSPKDFPSHSISPSITLHPILLLLL